MNKNLSSLLDCLEKGEARGTHRSTRQLEQAIKQYLDINNAKPKPFH